MDVKEETEIALKDAYWTEVRKLYDAYLHALVIGGQDKEQQIEAAATRFKKGLDQARSALEHCVKMSGEVLGKR